jgi:hypothetical protein
MTDQGMENHVADHRDMNDRGMKDHVADHPDMTDQEMRSHVGDHIEAIEKKRDQGVELGLETDLIQEETGVLTGS